MAGSIGGTEGGAAEPHGKGSEEAAATGARETFFGKEIVNGSGQEIDLQPPMQFLATADGDIEKAKRLWSETKRWREEHKIDSICDEPHPNFELIKKSYPAYIHKKTKTGCYLYLESPGKADLSLLSKADVTFDEMARHYAFITEFLWSRVDPRIDARVVSIFDLKGTRVTDLAGKTLQLVRKCMGFVQAHYPDRTESFFLINAPWWFQTAWSTLSPFVNAKTKERVFVLGSDYKKKLVEVVGEDCLPPQFGGSDTTELGESPAEKYLKRMIEENRKALRSDKE